MGSRDATRQALKIGLIDDSHWMNMIDNRNLTADTYNENTATQVVKEILQVYHPLFLKYEETMNTACRLDKIPLHRILYRMLEIFIISIFLSALCPVILERPSHLQKGAHYDACYDRMRRIITSIRHSSR